MTPFFLQPLKSMSHCLLFGICVLAMTSLAGAEVAIEPTAERFAEAVELLTKEQQAMLQRRFSYRLNVSQATFHDPQTELSKKTLRGVYKIAHEQFVSFLNNNLSEKNAPLVQLNDLRIYVASNNDEGRAASLFTIKLSVSDSSGKVISVEGFASGPSYSVFKVWNASKNPTSVRSDNLGYFAAFLRAAMDLEKQLGGSAPKPPRAKPTGSALDNLNKPPR